MLKNNNGLYSYDQGGQVLLIVVLVMVVALTVGLAVVSRSITNLRTTTEEENSQRALSAAEAGVEQAIKSGSSDTSIGYGFSNNATYSAKLTSLTGQQEFILNGGNPIVKNDGVDVWLVNHDASGSADYTSAWQQFAGVGTVTIYWGSSSDDCTANTKAAIEIIALSGQPTSPTSTRYAYDPCPTRAGTNNLSTSVSAGATIGGYRFAQSVSIAFPPTSRGFFIRAMPLYARTTIGVRVSCDSSVPSASCILPSQGKRIESLGISGDTARSVTFYQGYPSLPVEFFPNSLFSP